MPSDSHATNRPTGPKLTHHDARAIDLLLDGSRHAANGPSRPHDIPFASTSDGQLHQGLARAGRLLELLKYMPVAEPPANLIERTMRFVEAPGNRPFAPRPERRPSAERPRPSA